MAAHSKIREAEARVYAGLSAGTLTPKDAIQMLVEAGRTAASATHWVNLSEILRTKRKFPAI